MQKPQVPLPHPESSDYSINQHSFLSISQCSKFCITSVFFLFIVYNLTISPTIYWRDAPEFVDTAYSFGIAHPAGFPAYSTISKLFTFLPISNIAMRVNYVSMFFAVLTCWIIFYVIIELINICFKPISNYGVSLAAALGVLFLGGSASFWWQATVAEVYTMNCFFLSIFFLSSFRWYQLKKPKYLMLASFIFGISIGVYGANLLFAPVLLGFYLLANDDKKFNKLFLVTAFFLLGYSIYLYLPVRSLTDPAFDWGNPETITNFISHIMDKKDTSSHFRRTKSLTMLFNSLVAFEKVVISEITLAGFLLTIVGLICHFKKDGKSFFLLASIGFINTMFLLTSFSYINNGSAFLVSFLIFSCWTGLGIFVLIAGGSGYIARFKYRNIITPVIISFIIFSFIKDYHFNNKSSYYLPRDHAREMYISMEQKAVPFIARYWFAFRYFKDVENLRPDVSIVFISDILRPDIFNKVTPERLQMLNFPPIESKRENQHEFMQLLISSNINDKHVYWEITKGLTKYNYQYLIPGNKFLMRFVGHKTDKIPLELLEKFLFDLENSLNRELNDDQFFLDQETGVRSYYNSFLTDFADYLMKKGLFLNAIPFLDLALTMTDLDDESALTLKGVCYMNSEQFKQAEEIFLHIYKKNKDNYANNFNLASLYFGQGKLEKSKSYLKNIIMSNKVFESHFLLGRIYAKEENYDQAIHEITYAIEKTEFIPEKKNMQEALERVKKLKEERNNSTIEVQTSAISN